MGRLLGSFPSQNVSAIVVKSGDGNDVVRIAPDVTQPATIKGGAGNDVFFGWNLIARAPGTVRVGDSVEVLA